MTDVVELIPLIFPLVIFIFGFCINSVLNTGMSSVENAKALHMYQWLCAFSTLFVLYFSSILFLGLCQPLDTDNMFHIFQSHAIFIYKRYGLIVISLSLVLAIISFVASVVIMYNSGDTSMSSDKMNDKHEHYANILSVTSILFVVGYVSFLLIKNKNEEKNLDISNL